MDFSNQQLQGVNFKGAGLAGIPFTSANLAGAIFSKADITACGFEGAVLDNADFSNCIAPGVNFSNNQFKGADFRLANLDGADFQNSVFEDCDFSGANLTNAKFGRAVILRCTFSETVFSGADFSETRFSIQTGEPGNGKNSPQDQRSAFVQPVPAPTVIRSDNPFPGHATPLETIQMTPEEVARTLAEREQLPPIDDYLADFCKTVINERGEMIKQAARDQRYPDSFLNEMKEWKREIAAKYQLDEQTVKTKWQDAFTAALQNFKAELNTAAA